MVGFIISIASIQLTSRRSVARQTFVGLLSCLPLSWTILTIFPTTSAAELPSVNMDTVDSDVRKIFEDALKCVESVDNRVLSGSDNEVHDMYNECRTELCVRVPGANQRDCSPNESAALQLLVRDSFEKLLITSANAPALMGPPSSYSTEMHNAYQSYLSDRQLDCAMQSVIFQNQSKYFMRRCLADRDWGQLVLYRRLSLGLEAARRNPCDIEPTNEACDLNGRLKSDYQ